MSKIITVRFEVTDETTADDLHEALCLVFHEGVRITEDTNDAINLGSVENIVITWPIQS